jgi:hypothetical protein
MDQEDPAPRPPAIPKLDAGAWALRFLILFALTALPWSVPRFVFTRAYCAVGNTALGLFSFGGRGHARVTPTDDRSAAVGIEGNDTTLSLTVDGHPGEIVFGISARRELHLPLVLMTSVILSSPFSWRRRLRWLAIGVPTIFAQSLLFLGVSVVLAVGAKMPAVWRPSPLLGTLAQLTNEILIVPPVNRFALALGLALALIFFARPSTPNSTTRRPKRAVKRGPLKSRR